MINLNLMKKLKKSTWVTLALLIYVSVTAAYLLPRNTEVSDTYMATAVSFIVIGALFLIDKLIHFSSLGLSWVMNKDNMLLYASVCFLIFKRDKSIGFVLLGLWLVMNIGLVMSLLGSLSGYLLPLTLLIIGIILFWIAKR